MTSDLWTMFPLGFLGALLLAGCGSSVEPVQPSAEPKKAVTKSPVNAPIGIAELDVFWRRFQAAFRSGNRMVMRSMCTRAVVRWEERTTEDSGAFDVRWEIPNDAKEAVLASRAGSPLNQRHVQPGGDWYEWSRGASDDPNGWTFLWHSLQTSEGEYSVTVRVKRVNGVLKIVAWDRCG